MDSDPAISNLEYGYEVGSGGTVEKKTNLTLSKSWIIFLALSSTAILWSISFPVSRFVAVRELGPSPFTLALFRFSLAIPFMFLLTKIIHRHDPLKIEKEDIRLVALLGVFQISFYQYFFLSGMRFTSGSEAGLILNPTITLVTAIIASKIYIDEKLTGLRIIGILTAILGIVIVFGFTPRQDVANRLWGNTLIFFAAIMYAIYAVYSRPIYDKMKPLIFQLWATIFAWFVLLGLAIFEQTYSPVTHITWDSIWGVAYLGIFAAAIANTTFSVSIKNIGPTKSVVIINLVPLLAIFASVIILGELFSIWYLVAFAVTFAGVLMVNKS